jgi:hypothetical protein
VRDNLDQRLVRGELADANTQAATAAKRDECARRLHQIHIVRKLFEGFTEFDRANDDAPGHF